MKACLASYQPCSFPPVQLLPLSCNFSSFRPVSPCRQHSPDPVGPGQVALVGQVAPGCCGTLQPTRVRCVSCCSGCKALSGTTKPGGPLASCAEVTLLMLRCCNPVSCARAAARPAQPGAQHSSLQLCSHNRVSFGKAPNAPSTPGPFSLA